MPSSRKFKVSVVGIAGVKDSSGCRLCAFTSLPRNPRQVLNIQSRNGTVDCALFDLPADFHREFLHSAQNVTVITIRNTTARCDFEAPGGTYALAVSHDENSNGKLDTNLEGHANGRLWLFERRQSADRHVLFFCRRLLVELTDPRHDNQLALLSARFSPRCWTLMRVTQ